MGIEGSWLEVRMGRGGGKEGGGEVRREGFVRKWVRTEVRGGFYRTRGGCVL